MQLLNFKIIYEHDSHQKVKTLQTSIFCMEDAYILRVGDLIYHFTLHRPTQWTCIFSISVVNVDMNNVWSQSYTLRRKSTSKRLFGASAYYKQETQQEYLEGPISTWKDHDRNISVVVLPGTDTSPLICDKLENQKKDI